MPENSKVSVAWQIVFTFLPIINFWAFYRIRKLRKYLLYVIVPSIILSSIYYGYLLGRTPPFSGGPQLQLTTSNDLLVSFGVYIATTVLSLGLQGLAIYLVIIWSRLHNRRVDASTGQAPSSWS